jgi:hypothetical protein
VALLSFPRTVLSLKQSTEPTQVHHLSNDTIGLFVFPDGLNLTLYNFFAGLEGNLPRERFIPMWGGGAGNNFSVETPTYQYCNDEVITDGVSYALL